MKSLLHGLALSAALLSLPALADCEMPTLVAAIPDGTTASERELLAAQAEVRAYIVAMDAYIACQNEELRTNGAGASSEYLFQMATRIESARQEVDSVATRFNAAVNAFRESRPARAGAPLAPSFAQPPGQQPQQQSPQQPAPQPGRTPEP